MLKLLCTTAHPDDEVWAFGGSLLGYQEQGVETHVLCLTRGMAATNRGGAKSGEELSAMRTEEFYTACRLLKVTHPAILDYPDGGLANLNFPEVAGEITRRIREIKPDIILTLGLEGTVTAHVDHSMVGLFTTAAFHWAGRTDRFREQLESGLQPHRARKLYYVTAAQTWPERQPVSLAPVSARIDVRNYIDAKIEAFRVHESQRALLEKYGDRSLRQPDELFHLSATGVPQDSAQETDLFAGLR
ncbi:MAG TPA: PIG-L family deacetylase [Terriglobales bacterium]|nr:PIG-L family deacetylase [Terriglobales bacterium]